MSKLIITGVENGKISYIEGEEVNISVEEITEKVNSLREKISKAKENSLESIETEHLTNLNAIEVEFRAKSEELEKLKLSRIEEENSKYNEARSHCISDEDLQLLEKEESKLSIILGGLHSIDKPNEDLEVKEDEVSTLVEEKVEVETEVESLPLAIEESQKSLDLEQPSLATISQTSMPKPRRIIF